MYAADRTRKRACDVYMVFSAVCLNIGVKLSVPPCVVVTQGGTNGDVDLIVAIVLLRWSNVNHLTQFHE